MVENAYKYLFPFEKVPKGEKILIYGAGVLGQEYLKQILVTNYCEVIGFADRNYAEYPSMVVPIYPPDKVKDLDFTYVVIALRDGFGIPAISGILQEQGVAPDKIIYALERPAPPQVIIPMIGKGFLKHPAYERGGISIAFHLAGGIGDMICHKRFLTEIFRLVPTAKGDIFVSRYAEFVKWLSSDRSEVMNVTMDSGTVYGLQKEKYSLALSLSALKFLYVDHFRSEDFSGKYADFIRRIEKLKTIVKREGFTHVIPSGVAFYRYMYNGEDCYTWLNHGDVFDIQDFHVSIPFEQKYRQEFSALGLKSYITFNTGNGSAKTNAGIAKTWPQKNFQRVMELFKKKYPGIEVVQLGDEGMVPLAGADQYLFGKDIGLVAYILRGAVFHLDIEGGLVHLASQIGTKCIVLFGPTQVKYFGYDANINIRVGDCHDCYGLYPGVDQCARHMEEPECMYSITPEIVMEEIEKYMSSYLSP